MLLALVRLMYFVLCLGGFLVVFIPVVNVILLSELFEFCNFIY